MIFEMCVMTKRSLLCAFMFVVALNLSSCTSNEHFDQTELVNNDATITNAMPLPNEIVCAYNEYTDSLSKSNEQVDYQINQKARFWIPDFGENRFVEINAELISIGDHAYLWLDTDDLDEKEKIIIRFKRFDQEFAAEVISYFQFSPQYGIDNDMKTLILASNKIYGNYYYSFSEVPQAVNPYSNQHEILYLNASGLGSGRGILPLLGHELQHLLHWMVDPDEESWVSEGLSTFTETLINSYSVPLMGFNQRPDTQLNTWDVTGDNHSRYGASYLFFQYIADQYGKDLLQSFIANKYNGFDALEEELEKIGLEKVTEISITDQIFANWTIANLLNRKDLEQGQYGYKEIELPEKFVFQEIDACETGWINLDVNQYGTDYFKVTCPDKFRIEFDGQQVVKVVQTDPTFSKYFFWSHRANESKMTLTKQFYFSSLRVPRIEMDIWVWFDLEKNFDFVYVQISEDGTNWKAVLPEKYSNTCSLDGKTCGFNGVETKWHKETIDISECSRKTCYVQFVYTTDLAANADGFSIGRIAIPAINYIEDFSEGDGGWEGEGFVRIQNYLPQKFALSVIQENDNVQIDSIFLDFDNHYLSDELAGNVYLAVSGLTRNTTQPAVYRFRVISGNE